MPEQTAGTETIVRQYVNFICYRIDPAWYELEEEAKEKAREEYIKLLEAFMPLMILKSYSTRGLRADVDFFLWRISETLEPFETMSSTLAQTLLGRHLKTTYSFLSMTKRSMYVDKHVHAGEEASRTRVVPGDAKYLFIYPFVKTRQWYLLTKQERQQMMDEHIRIGHRYPSVKLNTTYSFGLDDQDFVLAFESDRPADFLDLVMELRETRSSLFTQRDTPTITGIQKPVQDILASL